MLKTLLIGAIAGLGLASAAIAAPTPYPPANYATSAAYFHSHPIPAQYLGKNTGLVVVKHLPHRKVWEHCGVMEGCLQKFEGSTAAYIFIDQDLPAAEQAFVERHERAHLNGWSHN